MYNRYIPQPDGTYQRSRLQDQSRIPDRKPPQQYQPQQQPLNIPPVEQELPCCSHCDRSKPQHQPAVPARKRPGPDSSISNFLKHLLPKDFDIEDLLIVILLLLMAGDCQEDQNTALLTLVLYLFL